MSTLLTIGTFDMPHAGHAAFLRRCERFADEVVVGINTDEFVTEYKGEPPLFSFEERCMLIGALGYRVLANDGPGRDLIQEVAPDILAIGSDWRRKNYLTQIAMTHDALDELGTALLYLPYTPGISTTILRARCSSTA